MRIRLVGLVTISVLVAAACGPADPPSAWVELGPPDVARSEHPAVVIDGEILVVGGLVPGRPGAVGVTDTVESYAPDLDRWSMLPPLPEPRHHVMAAPHEGRLLAIGGFDETGFRPSATAWQLTDEGWVEGVALPAPLAAGTAVTLDGVVYVVGGVPTSPLLRLDSVNGRWETLAAPPTATEHAAAVAFDGEIWLLGGRWGGDATAIVQIYDPTTNKWRDGPRMLEPRSGFGAAVLGGELIVAGGEVFDPLQALKSVEILVDGVWTAGPALDRGLHGNPLVGLNGGLYLPGGSLQPNGIDNPGTMLRLDRK